MKKNEEEGGPSQTGQVLMQATPRLPSMSNSAVLGWPQGRRAERRYRTPRCALAAPDNNKESIDAMDMTVRLAGHVWGHWGP